MEHARKAIDIEFLKHELEKKYNLYYSYAMRIHYPSNYVTFERLRHNCEYM